ncbi:MAG: hypothetical protein AABY22_27215 [Nanoarchaeota archaeon]
MKNLINFAFHKKMIGLLFNKKNSLDYIPKNSPKEILGFGLKMFSYAFVLYLMMYLFIFLCGYSYFSNLNDGLRLNFQEKNYSEFSLFLNSYPWNVLYVLASFIIMIVYVSTFSYLTAIMLEEERQNFKAHLGLCLHATSSIIMCLLMIYLANTIFPFNDRVSVVLFSILVSVWIIAFIVSVFLSTKVFVFGAKQYFGQTKKRAAITWLVPYLSFVYLVFGILTGI